MSFICDVTTILKLLMNIIEIIVVYYNLYDIYEKFSIVVTSQIKLIPTPSWLVYFVLKAKPFFIIFGYQVTI